MATLDLSNAKQSVNMTDPGLVAYGVTEPTLTTATQWVYFTPQSHTLYLEGSGMTYDDEGRALSGTVHTISIDLQHSDPSAPPNLDVVISDLNADAASLDGVDSFWRILEGDDVITGGRVANVGVNAFFTLFGDGMAATAGVATGGNDTIDAGDTRADVTGDVRTVGSQTTGAPQLNYRGGVDQIIGLASDRNQVLTGDAVRVYATGRLTGGNDTIVIQSSSLVSQAVGDALVVEGTSADAAVVIGGDDIIAAGANSQALLVGDVAVQRTNSLVRGGNDTIDGGQQGETIVGDVWYVDDNRTVGGDDRISGLGGDDILIGDAGGNLDGSLVTGGNDAIFGGEGRDLIYGEVLGPLDGVAGGRDTLYGDNGEDTIHGQTGDDLIDGGHENDVLYGGAGNDTMRGGTGGDSLDGGDGRDLASYEFASAGVTVALDGGLAASGDATGDTFVSIEGLRGSIFGDLLGGDGDANQLFGQAGNDTLQGRGGSDTLMGEAGADTLVGGGGRDFLTGGDGADIFKFNAINETGVTGSTRDQVTDFVQGSDKIDVAGIDANTATAGNQAFVFIGAAAFSGAAGELRAVAGATTTTIMGDVNGDSIADFHIRLDTAWNLTGGDFFS